MKGYITAIVAIFVASVGQIILKIGITRAAESRMIGTLSELISVIVHPMVSFGLFLYGVSALMWLIVLSELEVSRAYPILGLSYIFVLFMSVVVIGETLSVFKILGTFFVIIGIIIIGIE